MVLRKLLSDQVDSQEIDIVLRELHSCLARDVAGDVVELGCYVGTTSVYLAQALLVTTRQLYLYDSFEGLPDKTDPDTSPIGTQFTTGQLYATKRELIHNLKRARVPLPVITKGWFGDLRPTDMPSSIAFAFLDGDYYESIRDSLWLIGPALSPGATIVVDDYGNLALPGARRAVDEWLDDHPGSLREEHSLAIIKFHTT